MNTPADSPAKEPWPTQPPITPEQLAAAQKRMERRQQTTTIRGLEVNVRTPTEAKTICQNEICGQEFVYFKLNVPGFTKEQLVPKYCDPCQVVFDRKASLDKFATQKTISQNEHEARWAKICPQKYRTHEEGGETDMIRLRREGGTRLEQAMTWTPKQLPRGLLFHGETGLVKTRIMWRLLRRLFDEGKRITAFNSVSYGHECSEAFRDGTEKRWLESIMKSDVVFFDDLWKLPMTPRVDGELFGLIENLSAECIPYFCTTNFTGESLLEESKKPNSRISYDRAKALLRRLREDCQPIAFK